MLRHVISHGGHYLAVMVICALAVRPLAAARWPLRHPALGIATWQALLVSMCSAVIGLALSVGLAGYGTGELAGLWRLGADLAAGIPPPVSAWQWAVLGLAALPAIGLAVVVGRCALATAAARSRHRHLLDLAGERTSDGFVTLDSPLPVAYCVPGRPPRTVISTGVLAILDARGLEAVLAHERAHAAERHDLVLLPFAALRVARLPAWAQLSDTLLVAAIIGYVIAMVLHTAEVVVPQRTRGFGIAAVVVTVAAVAVHGACVLARAAEAGRVPWGNMYEFLLTAALVGAFVWLALLTRVQLRPLGLFVTLALAVLLGAAGRVHLRANTLMPALQSPWLRVHVAAAALATGLFLVGFVATALYLARLRGPAHPGLTRLPGPSTVDRLAARMHQIAFPIWTFAIATGAIWAEAAWGRYWGWDPKETWAFISWTLYTCYLHARSPAGWRGRRAAVIACAAWASMLINVFVVNIFVSGLHSYAGL